MAVTTSLQSSLVRWNGCGKNFFIGRDFRKPIFNILGQIFQNNRRVIALRMHIKDLVVLFHVWLKKPSLQIQSDVQEVNNFLVDSNKVQGEAIFPEDPVKFLSSSLCTSGGLGGYSKPVIFIGSNLRC